MLKSHDGKKMLKNGKNHRNTNEQFKRTFEK